MPLFRRRGPGRRSLTKPPDDLADGTLLCDDPHARVHRFEDEPSDDDRICRCRLIARPNGIWVALLEFPRGVAERVVIEHEGRASMDGGAVAESRRARRTVTDEDGRSHTLVGHGRLLRAGDEWRLYVESRVPRRWVSARAAPIDGVVERRLELLAERIRADAPDA